MKHFGNISNLADVVTKQYVDDKVAGVLTGTGSITPASNETADIGTASLRYKGIYAKDLSLSGTLGVSGATTLAALTASGVVDITNTDDYAATDNAAALKVGGGVYIAKKLRVNDNVYLSNNKHIYGYDTSGNTFSLLSLSSNNNVLIGYGGSSRANYNTYIDGNTIYIRNRYTADGSTTTTTTRAIVVTRNTVDSNTAVRVGIGTDSPTDILHVEGTFKATGAATLGSTLSVVGAAELGSSLAVVGNTGLGTAADSSNKLSVSGNTQLSGAVNITGVTGYAQGIRIHPSSGTSSIWFGAVNNTGFDAGMWGITVDTVTGGTPSTKIRIRGTATADSTTPDDYLTIINGGYVGINVTPSSSYRFYVSGASRFNGTVNLGGTTYYLGNGAAASKLYSLTVGSATALSVSSAGVVSIANETPFSGTASTGALKVSGGAYIAGNLGVYGKKIYFDSTHYLEYDSNANALHAYNMGFYADSFVNSGGLGVNGEGSGGSAITMLGSSSLGGSFGDSDLTQAFNAYTVNYINNRVTATNTALSSLRAGNIEFTSLLLQNTNNSPTLNFKGEYNNSQGANITLGSLSGYKETISSVAYMGLKVSNDLFIPNGKHLYTYNYNGAPRSIAYYATSNYNYLQLGDTAGVTNIKGSTVQINDNAVGTAAYKGTATSISSSSTDSSLATAKAVYDYVSTNCVTSSDLEDYVLSSSLGAAATKGVSTSLSSTSTNLITSKAVYDGCKHRFFKEYAQADFANSGTTVDTWWRVGSISTPYSCLDFVFTNNYNSNECASVFFNISQGYSVNGAKIGQPNYIITQTGGMNKFIKGIRIVYYNANRGSSYPTAYIEILLDAGATNKMWCECTTLNQTFTWLTTPTQGVIGSSSASSSYRATILYTSRGTSTSGGFDCTWLFDLAANASIGQTAASQFLIPQFLNALATGTPLMWVTESVTMNGVTYTMRYDVHVGKRGTAGLMLYYYNSPNSGTVEMTCIEIGYSSGWKVTAKYTKTL